MEILNTKIAGNHGFQFLVAETERGIAYFRMHAGRVNIEGSGNFYWFTPTGISDTDAARLTDGLRYCHQEICCGWPWSGPAPS